MGTYLSSLLDKFLSAFLQTGPHLKTEQKHALFALEFYLYQLVCIYISSLQNMFLVFPKVIPPKVTKLKP